MPNYLYIYRSSGLYCSHCHLAILLAACVTVLTVLITILVKDKIKVLKFNGLTSKKKASSTLNYEDVRHQPPAVDTQKSIAYIVPTTTSH